MSGTSGRSRVSILIAEDSATQAESLRHLLEKHGYEARVAGDGRRALALARQRKPTLVISDVVMPVMDGYALCKAIRADARLKEVPIILLTTLGAAEDVVLGLECGANNFLRKPYDDRYLLSRVDYLLMNMELRRNHKIQSGVEISLGGRTHFITSERQQILDLLVSTYEEAVHVNQELLRQEVKLAHSNRVLMGLHRIADGLNRAATVREVAEVALERALELPGIKAGWIVLREGDTDFRLAAARNLPPALGRPEALAGSCACRRRLLSGELTTAVNIPACERLARATGETHGLRSHVSVPLWLGANRAVGLLNLAGQDGEELFDEAALKLLHDVGNQVAVALERARLHEHLEHLVEERTAALTAEVARRKQIQDEQARLVAIIEATPDFVATVDRDHRALYMNQASLRMLGYDAEQDISLLQIRDAYPEWAAKQVLESAIPHAVEHGTWSGETAFRRRDGQEIPVSQVIIAHKGPDGAPQYLSTIARDISQQKAGEARITRLNRIYTVLSGINTTIVRVRGRQELFEEACRIAVEHGNFTFAWIGTFDVNTRQVMPVARAGRDGGYLDGINLNAAAYAPGNCLLTAEAITQAKAIICNDVASDERMAAWRSEALARGYRSVAVFPLMQEGKPVGVFTLYAPEADVFNEEEMRLLTEVTGDLSYAMDFLEAAAALRKLNEELEDKVTARTADLEQARLEADRANRTKSMFLATMSHEIRTPLVGVLGMLDVLSTSKLDVEQRRQFNVVQQSGQSLLEIIGDILDYSKIEADKMEIVPRPLSVRDLVSRAMSMFSGSAASKGLRLVQEVDAAVAPAHLGDSVRIRQILANLIGNAVKFTQRGSVTVSARVMPLDNGAQHLVFSVADTGIGIAPDQMALLFQPFTQASADAGRRFGGTGLGLTISRRLAELMGGTVRVESVPGEGTTMCLELPLRLAEPGDVAVRSAEESGPVLTRPKPTREQAVREGSLLLLAEDHPINRMVLTQQLDLAGFLADTAETGTVALEKFRTGLYGLVLTDLHMPGLDGLQLVAAIRAFEQTNGLKRTPVIALTANVLRRDMERCLAGGMDDYLSKPVTVRQLVERLRQWLPELDWHGASSASPPLAVKARAHAPVDPVALDQFAGGDAAKARAFLQRYCQSAADDLESLDEARRGASGAVPRVAHRIKGAALMIGAYEIADIAARIERLPKEPDPGGLAGLTEDLRRAVLRVEDYLRNLSG